jgi:hypothetical protein
VHFTDKIQANMCVANPTADSISAKKLNQWRDIRVMLLHCLNLLDNKLAFSALTNAAEII